MDRLAATNKEPSQQENGGAYSSEQDLAFLTEDIAALMDAMDIALWHLDTEYRVVGLNRKAREIYGDDVIGEFCYECAARLQDVCPDCPAKLVYEGAPSGRSEHQRINTRGERIYIDHIATPLRDQEGNLTGSLVLIIDISERKRSEEVLERRAGQLAILNRIGSDMASILDQQELFQRAVDAVQQDLGYLQAAVLLVDEEANELYVAAANENFWQMIPDGYRQPVGKGLVGTAAQTGEMVLVNNVPADSRAYRVGDWLSDSSLSVPIKAGGRVLGVLEVESDVLDAFSEDDATALATLAHQVGVALENARLYEQAQLEITDRRQAEQALYEEKMLLDALLNTTTDSLYFKDRQARLTRVSHKMLNDLNLDPSQVLGKTDVELFGEEFGRQTLVEDQRLIETGEPIVGLVEKRDLEDGGVNWTSTTKVPLRDAQGRIVGLAGITREINEIKQAEEAMRESEELFRSVVENSLAGIFIVDDRFQFLYTNDQFLEMVGYPRQEVIGQNFQVFLDDESRQLVADRYVRRQRGEDVPPRYEFNIVRKGGEKRRVEISSVTMKDSAGRMRTLAQLTDVTERNEMEQQIQESLARRAQQVQTSTEVSQEIAAAPALGELFRRVVTLVKERFGYYHTQIFRYEPAADAVVLVASYGEAGQTLLAKGHRLALGQGVVGTAAAAALPVLASDAHNYPDWLPNPHLPETRGELAVPIRWREQVLGILDVQSDQAGALTKEDQILLEGLCGQIASAIESTRLRQETEDSLRELERLYHTLSREGWQDYQREAEQSAYLFDLAGIHAAEELWLSQVGLAAERGRFAPTKADERPAVVAPLAVRSEVFGALGVQEDPANPLSDDDLALIEAVSEQVSQALESARLFGEEQRARQLLDMRVNELDCLNDIGRQIDQVPPIPEFLDWVAGRVPLAMQYPEYCRVAIEYEGHVYGASRARGLPQQMVQGLQVSGQQVGRVYIAYTEPHAFLDEESALLGDIARRVGGYVENRRLLQEMRTRAEQERLTRTITDQVRRAVDREAILRVAVQEVGQMLGASKAVVRLGTQEQLLSDQESNE